MMKYDEFLEVVKTRIQEEVSDAEVTIRQIGKQSGESYVDISIRSGNVKAVVALSGQSVYGHYKAPGVPEGLALDIIVAEANQAASSISNTIKNGGYMIEDSAFANNHYIDHISLPESIERIGNRAFWCSNIKTLVFPANLLEIGDSAFRGSEIVRIELPSGVKRIQRGAFLNCTELKKVSLPEGLEEIGHNAFQWCYNLEEINIPSTVHIFGKVILEDCKALKKLTCFDNFVIEPDTFGKTFPMGLIGSLETLEKNMTTAAYKKYVLVDKVWSKLNHDTQVDFFVKRNTKGSMFGYSKCIKVEDVDRLGESLLKKANGDDSNDLSRALYNYISLFHEFSDNEVAIKVFDALKNRKNTKKIIAELEQMNVFKSASGEESVSSSPKTIDCLVSEDLCYESMDSLADSYCADMDDFDIQSPIRTKLKKTLVTIDDLSFIVKFQSSQTLNRELPKASAYKYDPFHIINNKLYEERSEIEEYQTLEGQHITNKTDERQYITVKTEAECIAPEILIKRLKFFAKTVDCLQKEDVLKAIIEMMPKKKNGTLFLKRIKQIAPVMIADSEFGFKVLCAKAVKDTEVEISLRNYDFRKMEEVLEFMKSANEILGFIMKG